MRTCITLQDHPCLPGRRAEDCEEGVENTEDQRQDCLKVTLKWNWRDNFVNGDDRCLSLF